MSEADNARRWTDAERGVYEVWYLTWNHPTTGEGFWLRYITEAPVDGTLRGELWFARFDPRDARRTFGVHKEVALHGAHAQPFELRIAGAVLKHDQAYGALTGGGHDIRWDLHWEPAASTLRQLPDVMYARGGIGETTVLTPNPRVALTGTLIVDGEQLAFAGAVVGQTHLWGKKHAFSWMWGRCAEFEHSDAVLEVLCTRLQRRGVMLPPLTIVSVRAAGEEYRLNQFRHTLGNRGEWRTGFARFSAWSPTVKIVGSFDARPDQLIDAPYLDPDGTPVWCQNTEIGDARLTIFKRHGLRWREHARLVGFGTGHFETGGRERAPAVERVHQLA